METGMKGKKLELGGQKERETRPPKNRRSSEELDAKLRRRRWRPLNLPKPSQARKTQQLPPLRHMQHVACRPGERA